jgi:ParB-like nuclease family protein
MNASGLEVRTLPITALVPAPYNPRVELEPDCPAYCKLAASVREFGLVEPLIWNEATGHVVGGHLRLRILKEMGVTEVPVSVVRLSTEREQTLNVVLNNREAQGRFEPTKLADLLTPLQKLPEFAYTGFENRDLAALRFTPVPQPPPLTAAGTVEITLTMDSATYERCTSSLDALIGEFDLVSHVKRR